RRGYPTPPGQTGGKTWFNAARAFLPGHGPARPPALPGAGPPPLLLIQGTLHAATPHPGAPAAPRPPPPAPRGGGEGAGSHRRSPSLPANLCVNNSLNAYLANGAVPHRAGLVNATCSALPPPSPNS